jgi:hypothetical protein
MARTATRILFLNNLNELKFKVLIGFSLNTNDFQSMYSTYGFLTHSI